MAIRQLNHGLPGMGVKGSDGVAGEKGTSVYFGFINEFFSLINVDITDVLYAARRKAAGDGAESAHGVGLSFSYYTGVYDGDSDKDVEPGSWQGSSQHPASNFSGIPGVEEKYHAERNEGLNLYVPITRIIVDMTNIPFNAGESKKAGADDDGMDLFGSVYYFNTKLGQYQNWTLHSSRPQSENGLYLTSDDILSVADASNPLETVWLKPGYKRVVSNKDNGEEGAVADALGFTVESVDPAGADPDGKYYQMQLANMDKLRELLEEKRESVKSIDSVQGKPNKYLEEARRQATGGAQAEWVNYTKWRVSESEYIQVPQKLLDGYNVGDVLYVYTDQAKFELDNKITGMIVITQDMIGATYDYVLQHMIATDPFQFTDFETDGSRLALTTGLNIGKFMTSGEDDGGYGDAFTQNYNELASQGDQSPLILNSFSADPSVGFLSLTSVDFQDEDADGAFEATMSIYKTNCREDSPAACSEAAPLDWAEQQSAIESSRRITEEFHIEALSSTIKMPPALIRRDADSNVEIRDVLNAHNLVLDDDGYCRTLTEDDFDASAVGFKAIADKFHGDAEEGETITVGALVLDNASAKGACHDVAAEDGVIKLPLDTDGDYDFTVIPYIKSNRTIAHYGHKTRVAFTAFGGKVVASRGVAVTADSDDGSGAQEASEYVDFSVTGMTSAECSPVLTITPRDGVSVTGVYMCQEDIASADSAATNNVWLSKLPGSAGIGASGGSIAFAASNNLPQNLDTGEPVGSVDELMGLYSEIAECGCSNLFIHEAESRLADTSPRSELITVRHESADGEGFSHYKLTQPGFKESRRLPQVSLTAMTDPDTLEKCNADYLGVLGNQFQYFVEVSVDGFDETGWGMHRQGYVMDLTIKSSNENYEVMETWQKRSARPLATATIAADGDPDNYLRIDARVYDSGLEIAKTKACDYRDHEVPGAEVTYEYKHVTQSGTEAIAGASEKSFGGRWKICDIGSQPFAQDFQSAQYTSQGIIKDYTVTIKGIPLGKPKYYIRVLTELGAPVPACINYGWSVERIKIRHEDSGKEFIAMDQVYNNYEVFPGILHESAAIASMVNIIKPKYATGNSRFFINPLSMTACPEDLEKGLVLNANQVKITGSKDMIKGSLSMYGYGLIRDWIEDPDLQSDALRGNQEMVDWLSWNLKVKHLQDNVRGMRVINKNPFESLGTEPEPFGAASAIGAGAMAAFSRDGYSSPFEDEAYVRVEYNSELMYSKARDDVRSFYYNGDLLPAARYSQADQGTPAYAKFPMDAELRTDEVIKSMEVWSFEWEHSSYFNATDSVGGAISKYGNGYDLAPLALDQGQYRTDEALALSAIKDANGKPLLDEPLECSIESFNDCSYAPEKGRAYRTLLCDIGFEVPIAEDGGVRAYAMGTPMDALRRYIYAECPTGNYEKYANVIPYTLCYNIYPRFAFNYERDSVNVFMLRKPSVGKEGGCFKSMWNLV